VLLASFALVVALSFTLVAFGRDGDVAYAKVERQL